MQNIRLIDKSEIDSVMEIINDAKKLLSKDSLQWQQGYPNEKRMLEDISQSWLYGLYEDNYLIGIVSLVPGLNVDYVKIFNGNWTFKTGDNDSTIHRIAVRDGYHKLGIGYKLVDFCVEESRRRGYSSVKSDTHTKNIAMQTLLLKCGFKHTGLIYIQRDEEDNSRLAYEIVL